MKSTTLSVAIALDARTVYDFVSNLEHLPDWATAFCRSITRSNRGWVAETPQGPVTIRMAKRNALGVLDHVVSPAPGVEVFVPMRVVANGAGSAVLFTLFRRPEMSDAHYAQDMGLVEQDLRSLKRVMELGRRGVR